MIGIGEQMLWWPPERGAWRMEVDMGQVLIDGVLQGAGGFLRYRIRAEKAKGPGGSLSRDEFERLSGKLELLEIKPKKGA